MSQFTITYKGDATRDGFDMAVIGESMMGFNSLLKDFYKACGIDGELQVRTSEVKQGSVIITGQLIAEITTQLIANPDLFLEALKQVDIDLWQQLSNFLSALGNADKTINDFFKERQFTSDVVSGIIAGVAGGLLVWWLTTRKERKLDKRLTKLEQKIESLRKGKRFNKALKPLQENGYDSVTYAAQTIPSQQKQVTISDGDLDAILPEDDKILPEYENGNRFSATGEVKSLSSARGERVGITFHDLKFGSRTYTAFPDDKHTSASYRNLYGEVVTGEFEVYRKSMFKVPEFKIMSLEKLQTELAVEEGQPLHGDLPDDQSAEGQQL